MSEGPIRRVTVVGSSGSGKTTMATRLAERLGVPLVELDALNWGPNWTPAEPTVLVERVREATAGDAWVCDGNYSTRAQPIILERADTVVWLDLPLRTCLVQMLRRTRRRIRSREELWAGNRESWRDAFIGRDALFWWLLTHYRRNRRHYETQLASPHYAHLRVLRFRSSQEADAWLAGV